MRPLGTGTVARLVAATLAAALVTGLAGVAVVQVLERRELREAATDANLARAERVAVRLDDRIQMVTSQLTLLSTHERVVRLTGQARPELEVALRASPFLDEVRLYDGGGGAVAAASTTEVVDLASLPQRPLSEFGDVDGVGARIIHGGSDVPVVEITVPVENPPGHPAGLLSGRVSLMLLSQDIVAPEPGGRDTVLLTDDDGRILAHRDLELVLDGEVFDVAVFDEEQQASLDRGGEATLAVAARPETLAAYVVVEQPEHEIVGPADVRLGGMTQVLLAVVVAIAVVVVLAGRRLLAPLTPLAGAVERLERGDLDARVPRGGSGDLGVLANGFNRMAAALQARQRDLEVAEQAARESEERLRLMVEGVTDYAIVLLDSDGRIRSWNTGARRLTGYEEAEVLVRPLHELHDPDDPPPDVLPLVAADGRGGAEGWWRHADGTRFWGNIVATRLDDTAGAPYGYAAILHDLTQQRTARLAMEAALERERRAVEELREADRLKDEFLAVAAHEIRTPLSAILGVVELLRDERSDEHERVRFHRMLEAHAADMHDIVERLLALTRLQAGRVHIDPEELELRHELEDLLVLAQRELADHEVVLEAAVARVEVDRGLLRHVITNLVSNAAKYSPPGSTIEVGAQVEASTLRLWVRDEGPGIPLDERDLVFELFRQGSSTGGATARGTGVGLAIVRRYVDLAGGAVAVESAPGRGTTFTVTLPTQRP